MPSINFRVFTSIQKRIKNETYDKVINKPQKEMLKESAQLWVKIFEDTKMLI